MARIGKFFKKIGEAIKCTYLCLRYPFLYPRNRFTGLHYNNWKLREYHVKNYSKAVKTLEINPIVISKIKEEETYEKELSAFGVTISYKRLDDDTIGVTVNGKVKAKVKPSNFTSLSSSFNVAGLTIHGDFISLTIVYPEGTEIVFGNVSRWTPIVINRFIYWKMKIADFLNDYILQVFHCIPTHTEWYSMESLTGWNKAFGKQLLKDINKQLKKDKMRRKWRIMDIKEKYGSLQIYCNSATKEMYELLAKYEDLSYHTCIECGKPAKYLSWGYILPYCSDHFTQLKEMPYAEIDEKGEWKYCEPEEKEETTE